MNPSNERPPSRAKLVAVLSILAVLGAFGLSRAMRGGTGEGADSVKPRVVGDAAHGQAITDHPPPATTNPEAATAYAAALQDLRDGSVSLSGFDVYRATRLDTTFAAAHLLLAMRVLYSGEPMIRESFAVAMKFSSSLDERGLLLLHAAEVLVPDPPDLGELTVRLRAVLKRFPDDAEALFYLGSALQKTQRVEEARKVLHRAVTIDPQFAGALWLLAESYMDVDDDLAQALRAADRCLVVSPSASSCLRVEALAHRELGMCVEFEDDARRMTVVEPNGPRAYEFLASAIAASDAPDDALTAALDRWMALRVADEPSRAKKSKNSIDLALHALTGDFVAAEDAARERDQLVAEDTNENRHGPSALALIEFLEEEGKPEKALAVAEAFEARVSEWTANDPAGVRLYLLARRHHARSLTDAEFSEARDALLEEARKRWSPEEAAIGAIYVSTRYAETPAEVSDALARMAEPVSVYVPTEIKALMGRVYFLAGKSDDALPLLQRAAAACRMLPELGDGETRTTVDYMHTRLWLGQALEATHDKPGACAAYEIILERWKSAKPRSVTLEKAKARVKALGCTP